MSSFSDPNRGGRSGSNHYNHGNSTDPNFLRILVVGETNVGKTLLIRRLCHQLFASGVDPVDEDIMRRRWGPTVGFDVDALSRDAYLPSVVLSSHAGSSTYNRRASASSFSTPAHAGLFNAPQQQQQQQRQRCQQTVEFHEIGGTRHFRDGCLLPLQLIAYDGIMFLYDRSRPETTSYLYFWYKELKCLLTASNSIGGGNCRPFPKVMLVGTQLAFNSLRQQMAPAEVAASSISWIPDEAFISGSPVHTEASKRNWGVASVSSWGCGAAMMQRAVSAMWLVLNPSVVLSEQYQEEAGCGHGRVRRIVEAGTRFVMRIEHALLFFMSVVLFGPYQRVVPGRVPTTRQALDRIREDPQCIAQAHVCYLYDALALEASVDEILIFFDTIHREKIVALRQPT